jgi:hypothetical protein
VSRHCLQATAALAGALVLGCADQQSPTPAAEAPVPSLSVDRGTANFAFGFGNDERLVIIGTTLDNWLAFCTAGDVGDFEEWQVFTVTRPDGSFKQTLKGDDLHVLVWDLPADPCADTPVYTGTARALATDSDVDLTSHGADASGHRVTGRVTDASGQVYHLMATFLLTVAPEFNSLDEFLITWHKQKIEVRPIGR